MARPAQALINLSALEHNFQLLDQLGATGHTLAVIKANAYGHGTVDIARAMEPYIPMFGVASIEEAMLLRGGDIYKPVLLMEGAFSADEVILASVHNFALVCHCFQQVDDIVNANLAAPVKVWLKYDSGMHRLGFDDQQLIQAYRCLRESENVQAEMVLTTHLACADELDNDFNTQQIQRFDELNLQVPVATSIANSAGLMGWPEARRDWNRPGIGLYGVNPFLVSHPEADELKPVMTLTSAVISLRQVNAGESVGYGHQWTAREPRVIAAIAVGYGDGYPRSAKNGTPVLVNGHQVPLVGRVSMDMISVDVTDIPPVRLGDKVILWGQGLDVNVVAQWADTIGYELITRMPARVPRLYLSQEPLD